MITNIIFAQYKPSAGESRILYQVPDFYSAVGTLYIAGQNGYDVVSVRLIKAGSPESNSQYIVKRCPIVGHVPMYLQQIHLSQGDGIGITSTTGDCSFTFTGELISNF